MSTEVLGIDVGATGMKAALVDTTKGELTTERHKISTPEGGKPEDMVGVINELINHFEWAGKPIGIGFPAVIMGGKTLTASNIDNSWIGYPVESSIEEKTGNKVQVINDADAAGLAEITFGKGKGVNGTVILLTLGTGIGSAIFKDGKILRNTELGHILYNGDIAEKAVSNSARKKQDMNWKEYGTKLGDFLSYINKLFYPDLIILGGGISKKFDNYSSLFPEHLNVTPASQFNNAGIIGAALSAVK